MFVINEKPDEKYLATAFDQSSFCKFTCQIIVTTNTIKMVVHDEDVIKKRLQQCSKYQCFHENKSAFYLLIELNKVSFVKIQDTISYIVCDNTNDDSIIVTFKPHTNAQFYFIKSISHDEKFHLLLDNDYTILYPGNDMTKYRRLFTVQGHNIPVYYVNTKCKNIANCDLKQYPELELVKIDMQSDFDKQYESIKVLIKSRLGNTICTNMNSKMFQLYTFDDQMRVFQRLRYSQRS